MAKKNNNKKKEVFDTSHKFPKLKMFCWDGITPCNPVARAPGFCKGCV